MRQKELVALIRTQLLAGLTRYGVTGVPVKQGYQPTTQGRVETCVYFWLLTDNPEGAQYRSQVTDPGTLQLTTKETQNIASTFQVGALSPDHPVDDTQLTAKDLTVMCRQIVQSQPFLKALTAENIGMRRPTSLTTSNNKKMMSTSQNRENGSEWRASSTSVIKYAGIRSRCRTNSATNSAGR